MPERPITATLAATFAALDDLVRRDEDAQAHAEAQERVAFLLTHVQSMQAAVRRLRAATALLRAIDPGSELTELWAQTRSELRSRAPAYFRAPGRAIVTGHLDLLQLVEYTAASVSIAQERCRQLTDYLASFLAQPADTVEQAVGGPTGSSALKERRAEVEAALDRLLAEGSRGDAQRICREAGWLPR